jgi:hypothetical protein
MSSKRKIGPNGSAAAAVQSARDQVLLFIEKGRLKEAVKQAKICFKDHATPENHRLLERAYYLRARQLNEQRMRDSAVEVARNLLDFGVHASDWGDDFIRLLVEIGLDREAAEIEKKIGSADLKGELGAIAADLAVIHPERTKGVPGEVAAQATLIRQALERVEHNDEAGALGLLRGIGRSSVLAEWKFLIRGLAAFYRGATEDMQANFHRLDPKRKAYKIAERLEALAGAPAEKGEAPLNAVLEHAVFGEPVLERLSHAALLAASREWNAFFAVVSSLRLALGRIDKRLPERLVGAFSRMLFDAAADADDPTAHRLVGQFVRAFDAPPIDPKWNRLRALVFELALNEMDGALAHWVRFVDDLATVSVLNSGDRALAQAMVYNHMAMLHREIVADLSDPVGPFGMPLSDQALTAEDLKEIRAEKKHAVACLENSIQLAPSYERSYEFLIEFYREWDDQAGLESSAARLLERFPDHLETLELLAGIYGRKDEPAAALPLVKKARELKPLDEGLRMLEWGIRVDLVRQHALAKKWDLGREELRLAEALCPEQKANYTHLARRAVFEAKAGNASESDRYVERAKASVDHLAPVWLAFSIESIRMRLPKPALKKYAQLWEAELKKKCSSQAAGAMASLLDAILKKKVEYTGRASHIRKLKSYLQRAMKLKFDRKDIEIVCEFLSNLEERSPLLKKLVTHGLAQNRHSVYLNYRAGMIAIADGPEYMTMWRASEYLKTANHYAESSQLPDERNLLPKIQSALTLVNEMIERYRDGPPFPPSMPGFPTPGRGGNFFELFDDIDDDDDDEDEEEEEDGEAASGPWTKRGPTSRTPDRGARKRR